jgi:hypothetical protein
VQGNPLNLKLKPPGTKRLKLNSDTLLSASAFKFNLRRYTGGGKFGVKAVYAPENDNHFKAVGVKGRGGIGCDGVGGRGLHSCTSQLNLSRV